MLYSRQRGDPDDPGISLLEFESIMSFPREHLLFTMWYLKERNYLQMDQSSDYVITGDGVDYVEEHLPDNKILYKLLRACPQRLGDEGFQSGTRLRTLAFMSLPPPAIRIFLEVLVIVAAIWDIRTRRIPNWLTLSGVVLGVALNTFLFEISGLWFSLKGLGLAFGVYFLLYLLRAMGAGDVKLMAAVGAAAGWENWLGILVLTSIAGAVAGLLLVAFKGRLYQDPGESPDSSFSASAEAVPPTRRVPSWTWARTKPCGFPTEL